MVNFAQQPKETLSQILLDVLIENRDLAAKLKEEEEAKDYWFNRCLEKEVELDKLKEGGKTDDPEIV